MIFTTHFDTTLGAHSNIGEIDDERFRKRLGRVWNAWGGRHWEATSAQLDFYWANETSLSIRSATDAVILEGFRSYTVFQGTKYFVKVRALSFGTVCFCPLA